MFGWSMPPGCSGTPYDESAAEELRVADLPQDVYAFWVDGEVIVFQQMFPEGDPRTLLSFDYLGDDELNEAENTAAATAFASGQWAEHSAQALSHLRPALPVVTPSTASANTVLEGEVLPPESPLLRQARDLVEDIRAQGL